MNSQKVLIICASMHHGNTIKIAEVIGQSLNATIIKPIDLGTVNINDYDLVGFGSGIYNGRHHLGLFNCIDALDIQHNKKAFIFSTCTIPVLAMHKALREKLSEKWFDIVGEFQCKGFIDYGFTKYFGGFNKGRPNEKDLQNAKEFVNKLKNL